MLPGNCVSGAAPIRPLRAPKTGCPVRDSHKRSVLGAIAGIPAFAASAAPYRQNTKGFPKDAREALARHFAWLGSGVAQERTHRRSDPRKSRALLYQWAFWARPNQLPPSGEWRVWLVLAGRGFGKTRTGAEMIRARVTARTAHRLALVGPTAGDARDVMVEGESGILAISPPWERPRYEPSKRRLTWPNGAIATLFSADEPERLRGPQHDAAWCDELASWRHPEAWDMLMFGLRLGTDPRVVVTTTPRTTSLIRGLIADPTVIVTRGTTSRTAPISLRRSSGR